MSLLALAGARRVQYVVSVVDPGAAHHPITCCLCEATCGVVVETRGPEVVGIRGDKDDPFSRGYLCPKAMGLKDIHEDPERLRRPQKRTDSGWVEVDWDQAFDEVAAGLDRVRQRHGKHSIAIYQGNPSVHSMCGS